LQFSVIFNQILILFIPVIVGYICAKIKVVDDKFAKNLSAFLFNITMTCNIIAAFQFSFETSMLQRSGKLILIAAVTVMGSWFFGKFMANLLKARGYTKKIIRFSLTFANFGYMGYPVAQAFLGDEGLFYAAVFSIPVYILVQSIGMMTLATNDTTADGETKKKKLQWAEYILNAPMVGVFIGIFLFAAGIRLPFAIDGTVKSFAAVTTPMSMALAGLVLADTPVKEAFLDLRSYITAAFRLIIIPLTVFAVLRLLRLDEMTVKLPVIITMMPSAVNIIIIAANYDGDVRAAARYVLLSTLLSLITIPVMGYFLF
jgi:predicted permease